MIHVLLNVKKVNFTGNLNILPYQDDILEESSLIWLIIKFGSINESPTMDLV